MNPQVHYYYMQTIVNSQDNFCRFYYDCRCKEINKTPTLAARMEYPAGDKQLPNLTLI